MDALKEYRKKRSFNRTPEPSGELSKKSGAGGNSFVVQKHDATRLHYDFRLEIDGALKSWAVPKGPSLNPADKRLAMQTEDHPLDYGGFEGVIPQGNYGAGSVMLWDRGTYELLSDASVEEQLARGDFKFRLAAQKLAGEFALVRIKRGKGNEWLLIKKKDAFARPGWDPEDHGESVLTGRTQEEIARELAPAEAAAAASAHELDLPRGAHETPMPKIITPMLAVLGKGAPPQSENGWVYEIKWDGVRALCFLDSGKLRMLSRKGDPIDKQYPELSVLPHQVHGLEGVIGKRANSAYASRRTADWVKWKVANSSDFVICGFTPGDRDGLGALVLGLNDEGQLKWAGNVGTGFDVPMVKTLMAKLAP